MLSNNNYTRYVGIRINHQNRVFHTNLRASNESGFKINADETQMWHISSPGKIYQIVGKDTDLNSLKSLRNSIETTYRGSRYEQSTTHKDERLAKEAV